MCVCVCAWERDASKLVDHEWLHFFVLEKFAIINRKHWRPQGGGGHNGQFWKKSRKIKFQLRLYIKKFSKQSEQALKHKTFPSDKFLGYSWYPLTEHLNNMISWIPDIRLTGQTVIKLLSTMTVNTKLTQYLYPHCLQCLPCLYWELNLLLDISDF